jgi:hypothetical protein
MYLSLWSSLNLFVSAGHFSPRNICYISLLLCLRYPGETEHVYCCISLCSCSLCFWMEFYLWIVRWMSYVHVTIWNVEGQKPKQSFFRLVSAVWDQKHIYFILKNHNKHLSLPFIFSCVWYSNLESARHYCRDYLLLKCINCKDLYVIFLFCSLFMSISCSIIQFSPFQPNKMYVAGHSRILVIICSLCKPVCYLQVVTRWLLNET